MSGSHFLHFSDIQTFFLLLWKEMGVTFVRQKVGKERRMVFSVPACFLLSANFPTWTPARLPLLKQGGNSDFLKFYCLSPAIEFLSY